VADARRIRWNREAFGRLKHPNLAMERLHMNKDKKPAGKTDPHPEMMGDETEEQNLNQPGNPGARIKRDEVEAAFKKKPGKTGHQ
jgi:hypothetical protein